MLLAMSNAALPEKNVRLKVKYDKKALNRARQQREKKLTNKKNNKDNSKNNKYTHISMHKCLENVICKK